MRVLIVKAGATVPRLVPRRGDFDDWFRGGLAPLECDVVRPETEPLPPVGDHAAVVVTGSSAMVTDGAAWSLAIEAWLADAVRARVRVLGVCYGHQLLARALGGEAGWNSNGRELGTVNVDLTAAGRADPLFDGVEAPLAVQSSHSQSVLVLPDRARLLAYNEHDAHQAFAVGDHAWGLQFHPEFDADIVRGYVEERRETVLAEGLDADALAGGARDSDDGRRVLANFARLVASV